MFRSQPTTALDWGTDGMVALQEAERPAPTQAAPRRSRVLRTAIVAVAAGPPLTQVAYLFLRSRDEWTYVFADDAYYYLGVARNIGAGHGSTFSGLTETNGYHPLWELVLSAVAFVVRDPHLLVAAVVVVQCLLWLLLVREGVRIGRALGSEAAAVAGLALLGTLAVITGQLSFSAMESAPLLVLLVLAVRLVVTMPDDDPRSEWRLGAVFALVVLTRLDAALTVGPLALMVALSGRPPMATVAQRGLRLLAPAAGCLVVYVALNMALFGTASPVSGQAKSLGAPFANWRPVEQFFQAGQVGERPLWIGAASLVLTAAALVFGDWRSSAPARRLMGVTAAVLVGQALLLAYLVTQTSYQVWAWYFYGIALVLLNAGTIVGLTLVQRVRWGSVACAAAGLAFVAVQVPAAFFSGENHSPRATETAEFLSQQLPDDAVIAMGDRAGLVGYLADRPMLQLEGLMADEEWLHDLEDGTAVQRMIDEGVDYYVWSGALISGTSTHDGTFCRNFTEPRAGDGPKFEVVVCYGSRVFHVGEGHDQFTVYRFDPEANR